ncbi:MAG: hypothetical protein ACK4NA_12675 [Alphaproteobacteria bacterium]
MSESIVTFPKQCRPVPILAAPAEAQRYEVIVRLRDAAGRAHYALVYPLRQDGSRGVAEWHKSGDVPLTETERHALAVRYRQMRLQAGRK